MNNWSRVVFAVITVMTCVGMGAEAQNSKTAASLKISRASCGTTQFCAAEPKNCDPSVSGSCFFISTRFISGQNFSFQLQGQSSIYIAVVLSRTFTILSTNCTTGQHVSIYLCINVNNTVYLFSAFENGVEILTTLPSNLVMGSVSGQTFGCIFTATVPNATTTRSSSTNYFISIYAGTVTNGTHFSNKAVFVSTAAVDLSDPTATATNSINSATPNAFGPQRTLSQALLILLGGLVFIML